jgi:hypothetical protein
VLIVFPVYVNSAAKSKARRLLRRRAFWFFDLSGRLIQIQAMAVRRHGCPMMVVMTVMAAAEHLFQN